MVSQIDCSDLPATITIIAQLVSCTFIKTGCKLLKFAHPSLVLLVYLPHRCLRCHYHPRSIQTWWYRCSISSTRSYIWRHLRVALWTDRYSPVVQGAIILSIANFESFLVVAAAPGGCVLVTGGVAWNLPIIWSLWSPGRILASRGLFASCCFSPSPGLLSLKVRMSDTLGLLFIGDSACQTARLLDWIQSASDPETDYLIGSWALSLCEGVRAQNANSPLFPLIMSFNRSAAVQVLDVHRWRNDREGWISFHKF